MFGRSKKGGETSERRTGIRQNNNGNGLNSKVAKAPPLDDATSFLLDTARRLRQAQDSERILRAPGIFAGYVRSVRASRRLSRGKAARRSKLDQDIWTAVECGHVSVERLTKFLPQLARGLGYSERELRQLLDEALNNSA
jgi:hypothetical protein